MIQMHFGSSRCLAYGLYHPAGEPRLRRGVLLLNPYGWEALRAHRTLRTLALRLTRAGFDVFRFDYSCTGDSLGDRHDASFEAWLEDAEYALDELHAVAGVGRISLVGLRMGALVASLLAERRADLVDRRVLWAPPATGDDVVDWARSGHRDEVAAFPIGPRLEEELRGVDPTALRSDTHRTLVLATEEGAVAARDASDRDFLLLPAEEPRCWLEDRDYGAGAVPVGLLEHIVEWLAA